MFYILLISLQCIVAQRKHIINFKTETSEIIFNSSFITFNLLSGPVDFYLQHLLNPFSMNIFHFYSLIPRLFLPSFLIYISQRFSFLRNVSHYFLKISIAYRRGPHSRSDKKAYCSLRVDCKYKTIWVNVRCLRLVKVWQRVIKWPFKIWTGNWFAVVK